MAGRAVRRHLQKANEQIGAIKTRLNLPDAGGLLILMNEAEPMIDISAIGYTLKTAFETVDGAYPHITNVWAIVESHRIAMPGGRNGLPHLHVFKSLKRQAEVDFIERMLGAWGHYAGSRMERLDHRGDWTPDLLRSAADPQGFRLINSPRRPSFGRPGPVTAAQNRTRVHVPPTARSARERTVVSFPSSSWRRPETGTHHRIAGSYLLLYANDAAWRGSACKKDHCSQTHRMLRSTLRAPQSRSFSSYWQRGSANHRDMPIADVLAAFTCGTV